MFKVNRNAPSSTSASEPMYTVFEFDQEFPDDAACLDYLVGVLYPNGIFCPKCQKVTKHHREKNRPSYACQYCGHHEHPLKGTIFEGSATSLKLWFYGMYLMASTRCGISAKQLERELGVTYKTAWRMFNKIRAVLDQDDEFFSGTVEMDEAYIGGRAQLRSAVRSKAPGVRRGRGDPNKVPVLGMAQRGSVGSAGKVYAKVAEGVSEADLMPRATKKILPGSIVYTDDWYSYNRLEGSGYKHSLVPHGQKVCVSGDVHTNSIDSFWSLLKRGIVGVYHSVSTQHLQSYLDEYTFRYNDRDAGGREMFSAFLDRMEQDAAPSEAASKIPLMVDDFQKRT
jgi:transposase